MLHFTYNLSNLVRVENTPADRDVIAFERNILLKCTIECVKNDDWEVFILNYLFQHRPVLASVDCCKVSSPFSGNRYNLGLSRSRGIHFNTTFLDAGTR